jgi:predicted AlkP superfamily pyrophosphatase or phosphodiesterase
MAPEQSKKLLSRKSYDRDAQVIQSDDESDDDYADGLGRKSEGGDDHILQEDAEVEELLSKPGKFSTLRKVLGAKNNGDPVKVSRREERRQRHAEKSARKRRRSSMGNEDGQLMFEMEEGNPETSSISSADSLDLHRSKWAGDQKHSVGPKWKKMTLIHALILILFMGLGYGAYKASRHVKHIGLKLSTLSNGTHLFAPTTILISLDGFRADFLNREITPALNAFIASGVSPRYMLPSFPSVTFPNHFTLVTGLYPESHGVVGNQFWDPALQEEFYYTHTKTSMQPRWWTAEPLWVTAEDQGVRTAIHMWPGSEAHIPNVDPTYLDKYNGSEVLPRKVERILGWLDLPGDDDNAAPGENLRPQLIAAYVPDVDADGHKYGPNSTEIRGTISDVDSLLTLLVEGLLVRNLTEIVNIIVVSDHGMATTSTSRAIQLDDLIDLSLVDHIDGWPLRGLRLKNSDRDVPILHEQLLEASKQHPGAFDVYTKETMPKRYHFTNNDRIAPLWVVPKTGWAVVEKTDIDLAKAIASGEGVNPKGLHGYDHEHPLMRAIFVARGPAFPHTPNSRVPVFQNIEVYNIVCDSLGITPHPNNGTLRLPLKTQGLHSDPDAPELHTPHDPDPEPDVKTKPEDIDHEDLAAPPGFDPEKTYDDGGEQDGGDDEQDSEGNVDEENPQKSAASWWEYVHSQIEKAKEWAKEIVDSLKDNKKPPKEDGA